MYYRCGVAYPGSLLTYIFHFSAPSNRTKAINALIGIVEGRE